VALLLLLLLASGTAFASEPDEEVGRRGSLLVTNFSERDILIHVSSIEWGSPDRWSFTTRYIRRLGESDGRSYYPHLTATLSPGSAGGRLGLGYLGIWSPSEKGDFGIIHELRGVYLRNWGNPMDGRADAGYLGAELRLGLGWINAGVGYYSPLSADETEAFWGWHLGLGL